MLTVRTTFDILPDSPLADRMRESWNAGKAAKFQIDNVSIRVYENGDEHIGTIDINDEYSDLILRLFIDASKQRKKDRRDVDKSIMLADLKEIRQNVGSMKNLLDVYVVKLKRSMRDV